ncbi:hypothetical protein BDN70DRAFT_563352 [Pholiota conissans]|uniref:Uncharacterized protein n=1 Tax=Pholiota conissans TaxID=109636 RepID=A0A9P6CLT3_9AGAR|nr:hypothetical protein BDN70DRAFT_563352 [Pholiota conissans]
MDTLSFLVTHCPTTIRSQYSINCHRPPPQPVNQQSLLRRKLWSSPPPVQQSIISSLTVPPPVFAQLQEAVQQIQNSAHSTTLKIAWCYDVLFLIIRASGAPPSTDPLIGPVILKDVHLYSLAHLATPIVLQVASSHDPAQEKSSPYVAVAISMPSRSERRVADLVRHQPRTRGRVLSGGVELNVESCSCRIGMIYVSLLQNPSLALPLLQRAALLASLIETSARLRLCVPTALLAAFTPPHLSYVHRSPTSDSHKLQYKLGHVYEFAEPPLGFPIRFTVECGVLPVGVAAGRGRGGYSADQVVFVWDCRGSGCCRTNGGCWGADSRRMRDLGLAFVEKVTMTYARVSFFGNRLSPMFALCIPNLASQHLLDGAGMLKTW